MAIRPESDRGAVRMECPAVPGRVEIRPWESADPRPTRFPYTHVLLPERAAATRPPVKSARGVQRGDEGAHGLFRIPEEHQRIFVVANRVVDAGVARAHASLEH